MEFNEIYNLIKDIQNKTKENTEITFRINENNELEVLVNWWGKNYHMLRKFSELDLKQNVIKYFLTICKREFDYLNNDL